ncbi:DUF4297 domain-containing protein [Helcococcus ovis]|uniref:DUF4297 domain-containing protein n=1 Tax=Helcococcus ovis TaxID=72026 RepID=UPI00142F711D|nr:DUF4297 domain-containing protein [Helcococcus ovis]
MNISDYYMSLPKDLSGSITKNRFRLELLWGINQIIDEHKTLDEYSVIFDFKCDIELHKADKMYFYQIKTKKSGNYNDKQLCQRSKEVKNSILGKLYALYSPGKNIKLAIVCNQQLKIKNKNIDFSNQCFGELESSVVDRIKNSLCDELGLKTIDLDNVFYIFENMDLLNPEDSIRGKLIKAFVEIKGEEPQNPNALYRLVSETVKEKASYEFDLKTYDEVVKYKGVTRTEFNKMLDAHKKESKKGILETQDYINKQPLSLRRKYNTALGNLIDLPQNKNLNMIKINIFNYIKEHVDELNDVDCYLDNVSKLFDEEFGIEFTKEMKMVQYLLIYFVYASGGEI